MFFMITTYFGVGNNNRRFNEWKENKSKWLNHDTVVILIYIYTFCYRNQFIDFLPSSY